ncbi:MAG: DUF1592 domain-containing protein [Planctomycetota bacterium]|nr:DUF1592 domain-containing protein [Planctomycetota bacterium]
MAFTMNFCLFQSSIRVLPFLLGLAVYLDVSKRAWGQDPPADYKTLGKAFIDEYCAKCHSEIEPQAEMVLTRFSDSDSIVRDRKIWMNVIKQVQSGLMPPKEEPLAAVSETEEFVKHIQAIFDRADREAKPQPGRVTMRRLNRLEYKNTIRDLIGVDFDPTGEFPSDDIGYGFDNIGDVLSLPPVLMERYLDAAEGILSRAITPEPPAVPKRHLSSQYTEPASAEVASKLMENGYRRLDSLANEGIETGPIHTAYQWEASGEYLFRTKVYGVALDAQSIRGVILLHGKDLANPSSDAELETISGTFPRPARILKTFEVTAQAPDQAQVIEVSIPAMANRDRVMVGQLKRTEGQSAKLYVEHLSLDGPLDTRPDSHRRLLAVDPGKSVPEQTREALGRFMQKAYRRPIEPQELEKLSKWVDQMTAGGQKWESAMQVAMQAVLCSPKFLFRVETDDQASSDRTRDLDSYAVASRLSYFLWSSMPDELLFDAADRGTLLGELSTHVTRMLADPRSNMLVQSFATQWLQIQRLDSFAADAQLFPSFGAKLKSSMKRETELFFESILRENRSVLELIDADYTYLDEALAKHYGIADTAGNSMGQAAVKPDGKPILGESFQRVALQDRNRGGLITQASVLTATSNPTRTSPVKRGRWILEQFLGEPPPPPPPNVPELPTNAEDISSASLRKRMEVHRHNPACANCHAKMDPIGFALENFNAIGAYRTKDGAFDIDASGQFADGSSFAGPGDLKSIILRNPEDFVRCLTEKMLTYALGRGVEYYDRPTIEKIVSAMPAQEYKFQSLVREIVKSEPFLRRGKE